jgi:hypothetical protein
MDHAKKVGSGMQDQDLEPDLDPLIKSKDPRIRIRSNMSRIRNTACFIRKLERGNENLSAYPHPLRTKQHIPYY